MRALGAIATAVVAAVLAASASAAPSTGTRRVLVVPVTWGPQPFSERELHDAVLGTAADWLHRASSGRLTLTGSVLPWQKVIGSEVVCSDRDRIAKLGLAAARAANVDPAAYDDEVFVLPPFSQTCREGGYGIYGGDQLWLYGSIDWVTIVHELGHTFGLEHGNSWTCAGACEAQEYGDPYTVMGHGNGLFDAYALAKLGWLDGVAQARDGTFELGPIEVQGTAPRALVVPTAHNEYWIDHREPIGLDAGYGAAVAQGVAIHAEPNRTEPVAQLGYGGFPDVLVPVGSGDSPWLLAPGGSFTLPGVFRLDVLSHAGGRVTVSFHWLDRTRPSRPVLDPVDGRAACRTRSLDLTWTHSTDAASGVTGYEVALGGRPPTRVVDDFRFEPETHVAVHARAVVSVRAIDHAGNRSAPAIVRLACR